MEIQERNGDVYVKLSINNNPYTYTKNGFRTLGYTFIPKPTFNESHPLDYWKAQLAFRGYSSRGSNLGALKTRLRHANTDEMDPAVSAGKIRMAREYLNARKDEEVDKWANRIVDTRLARTDPKQFIQNTFYDYGDDKDCPPVALEDLCAGERAHLHNAASHLFHETTVTNVMVIGSKKNQMARELVKRLNRAAGWPPEPYEPQLAFGGDDVGDEDEEEVDQEEEEDDEENEISDEEEQGSDGDTDDEDGSEVDGPWDITGLWEVECPKMASCFGQYKPYTLEIFTTEKRLGRETHGKFDFDTYKGYFRFSTADPANHRDAGGRVQDPVEEYLLDPDDIPSLQQPTRCYRWRGKEFGEGVIVLGSDHQLYTMTFSNGGREVEGTWATTDGDPGSVTFKGVKIRDAGYMDDCNIDYFWKNHSQAAYDKANRDRWRN